MDEILHNHYTWARFAVQATYAIPAMAIMVGHVRTLFNNGADDRGLTSKTFVGVLGILASWNRPPGEQWLYSGLNGILWATNIVLAWKASKPLREWGENMPFKMYIQRRLARDSVVSAFFAARPITARHRGGLVRVTSVPAILYYVFKMCWMVAFEMALAAGAMEMLPLLGLAFFHENAVSARSSIVTHLDKVAASITKKVDANQVAVAITNYAIGRAVQVTGFSKDSINDAINVAVTSYNVINNVNSEFWDTLPVDPAGLYALLAHMNDDDAVAAAWDELERSAGI
jgi:hypothetical protein